jgi:uncharacterized protein YjbJ (UPF0337 family)
MQGRTKRGKGRLRESLGALTDNKRQKDKGRFEQAVGSTMRRADRVFRRVRRR